MMNKIGIVNIPCTYCDEVAVPDTDPPVCEKHMLLCKHAKKEEPVTLKQLEAQEVAHDENRGE